MVEKILNYIDGKLCGPYRGEFLENINPATEEVYSQTPSSSKEDVNEAVRAAKAAFPMWRDLSAAKRGQYLKDLAKLIEKNFEKLALAESIDTGKPISTARKIDIPRSRDNLNFFAEEVLNFGQKTFPDNQLGENHLEYSPLGVVATISPWNLPLYLFTWKIAPALASGNTVVAKPSEVTPMTAYLLSQLCIEADFPPGVLNIVHGLGKNVGESLTTHEDIKAVSFTGSTDTGKIIAKNCSESLKKYSLEMGGKNPNIIFDDCDFENAVNTTLKSSFF